MIAGQYVTHAGHTWQLRKIYATSRLGPGGMPTPAAEYALVCPTTGASRYLLDPTSDQLRLAPGCGQCCRAPGFSRCHLDGHQGSATAPAATRPLSLPADRAPCDCGRWTCSDCGFISPLGAVR